MAEVPQKVSSRVPWGIFLLLAAIFLVGQDLYSSQSLAAGHGANPAELERWAEEGSPSRRIAYWGLGAFAVTSLYLRRKQLRINGIGNLGWLVVFFQAWALLSLTWSDDPSISLRRLGLFTILWLTALAVSKRFQVRDIVLWVFLSALCYMHIGVLVEVFLGTFHPLSTGYRFAGTLKPNGQGLNCALLLIASLFLAYNERRWRGFFAIVACEALVFLVLTKSRTSLGAALVALLFGYFVTAALSRKGAIALGGLGVLCFSLLFADFILPTLQHIGTLGRVAVDDTTLTGRIPLWAQTLSFIAERPLHGYGYDAFWTPRHLLEVAARQGWTVPNAHSVYLDLCLGLGMIGGGLYALIMIVGIKRALVDYRPWGNTYYVFFGVVLLFVVLVGVLETIVFYGNPVTFITMLILLALSGDRLKREEWITSLYSDKVQGSRRRGAYIALK